MIMREASVKTQGFPCSQLAQLCSGALQWLPSRPAADTANLPTEFRGSGRSLPVPPCRSRRSQPKLGAWWCEGQRDAGEF